MRREIDGLRVRIQGDAAPLAALVRALGATVS
jgi:erythronate-4-phosphate dehydrogenase